MEIYPLVNKYNYGKPPFLMGKSTINGPFSSSLCQITRGYESGHIKHVKTMLCLPPIDSDS